MTEENKKEEVKKEEPKAEAKEAPKADEAKKEAPKAEAKEAPKVVADGKPKAPSKPPEKPEAKADGPRSDNRGPGGRGPGGNNRGPGGPGGRGPGGPRKGQRSQGRGGDRDQPSEFTEKVIQIRRVTKVVKGGKKLSFRAVVIIGNEKGKVGVGTAKASEVINAIKKAVSDAKKNLVEIKATGKTISHHTSGRSGGARVVIKPAAEGTGIIAGGAARTVLELSGLGDVLAKSLGSSSPLNLARATVNALLKLREFKEVAGKRGLTVKQMLMG